MSNEQVLEYIKKLASKLTTDIMDDIGNIILETNDVDPYKEKISDIVTIVVTNEVKERLDKVKEEMREKYGITNPDVIMVPAINSLLRYIGINEAIKNIAEDNSDDAALGIPEDVYEEVYEYFRDSALTIKRKLIPEIRDNVIALKDVVAKMMSGDSVEIEDVILPKTNIHTVIEDRGLLNPTGASANIKDLRLLNGVLPASLLDYDKVIDKLRMSDVKVLFEEYRKEFIGWEHIDEEISDILDDGVLASIAMGVNRKIKLFELPVTLSLLLMFRSLMENHKEFEIDPTTYFGIKVIYDLLIEKYKTNMTLYNLKINTKQPIYGIEGTDHPVVYLLGELLEEYDLDVLNAYALYVFETYKAKRQVNQVVISTVDKIDDIIANKDKYINYLVNYNKLRAAKRLDQMYLALANAYGLQLSNNSPILTDYLVKDYGNGYNVRNELFKISKEMINTKTVDPMDVSNSVLTIVGNVSIGTDLANYIEGVLKYDKLVDNTTDVNLLSMLGVASIITDNIINGIAFLKNDSKR